MTTLEHAIAYIRRGWSVVPLVPGTKRPAVELSPFLSGARRMTEDDARCCWPHGDAGIAIITGKPSDLVVVDVDPRNGGDIVETLRAIPGHETVAATGGGGVHVFCVHPGGHVACGKTSRAGVDRKGDGGYIVAPPSIHPNGTPYTWLNEGELSDLPAWVLESPARAPAAEGEPSEPWIARTLAHPEDCLPGGQEETLSRLAWWASRAMPFDIALATLARWCRDLPLGRPSDPWTGEHVAEKLNRACEKRATEPVVFDVRLAAPLTGASAGQGASDPEQAYAEGVALLTPIANLEFPDQPWIVEDFAAPGAFTEVIGKVKKGKSTLVYQLIDAVRKGEPFLGRATTKTGAIVLTEQVGTSLKKTIERAGLLGAEDVLVLRKADIKALGGWERAVWVATQKCIRDGIGLLVVDTLSRLAGLGGDAENKAGAVVVLDAFEAARAAGVACLFVRHARKGMAGEADDIADVARGSSAITGDMDIVVRVTTHQEDYRCVSWESRITDDPEDIFLEYQDGKYVVVDKPATKRDARRDAALETLRAAIAKVGDKQADLARETGWARDTVRRHLRALKAADAGGMSVVLATAEEDE